MTGPEAVASIDRAIAAVGVYVTDHAEGTARYGWGWCADAAKVALTLAEVRDAVAISVLQTTPRVSREVMPDVGTSAP